MSFHTGTTWTQKVGLIVPYCTHTASKVLWLIQEAKACDVKGCEGRVEVVVSVMERMLFLTLSTYCRTQQRFPPYSPDINWRELLGIWWKIQREILNYDWCCALILNAQIWMRKCNFKCAKVQVQELRICAFKISAQQICSFLTSHMFLPAQMRKKRPLSVPSLRPIDVSDVKYAAGSSIQSLARFSSFVLCLAPRADGIRQVPASFLFGCIPFASIIAFSPKKLLEKIFQ